MRSETIPETIPEEDDAGDAPYTSFSGTPRNAWGDSPRADADDMETTVSGLIFESVADKISNGNVNATHWMDANFSAPSDAVSNSDGTLTFDAT